MCAWKTWSLPWGWAQRLELLPQTLTLFLPFRSRFQCHLLQEAFPDHIFLSNSTTASHHVTLHRPCDPLTHLDYLLGYHYCLNLWNDRAFPLCSLLSLWSLAQRLGDSKCSINMCWVDKIVCAVTKRENYSQQIYAEKLPEHHGDKKRTQEFILAIPLPRSHWAPCQQNPHFGNALCLSVEKYSMGTEANLPGRHQQVQHWSTGGIGRISDGERVS